VHDVTRRERHAYTVHVHQESSRLVDPERDAHQDVIKSLNAHVLAHGDEGTFVLQT
jgi:hypothetical protein